MDLDTDEPQVCGFNVGDCTCMVLRPEGDGKLAVDEDSGLTTPRFHENGAPFQLAGRDWQSDSVSDGDSFAFGVGAGSVVLCCTDGLTCNLSPADAAAICREVSECTRCWKRTTPEICSVCHGLTASSGPMNIS